MVAPSASDIDSWLRNESNIMIEKLFIKVLINACSRFETFREPSALKMIWTSSKVSLKTFRSKPNEKTTVMAKTMLSALMHHNFRYSLVDNRVLCLDGFEQSLLCGVYGVSHTLLCFQNLNYKLISNNLGLNTVILDIYNQVISCYVIICCPWFIVVPN